MSLRVLRAFTDCNPHDVSRDANAHYPATADSYPLGVSACWTVAGRLAGVVEFMAGAHPTAAQQAWIDAHPHIGPSAIVDVEI